MRECNIDNEVSSYYLREGEHREVFCDFDQGVRARWEHTSHQGNESCQVCKNHQKSEQSAEFVTYAGFVCLVGGFLMIPSLVILKWLTSY